MQLVERSVELEKYPLVQMQVSLDRWVVLMHCVQLLGSLTSQTKQLEEHATHWLL